MTSRFAAAICRFTPGLAVSGLLPDTGGDKARTRSLAAFTLTPIASRAAAEPGGTTIGGTGSGFSVRNNRIHRLLNRDYRPVLEVGGTVPALCHGVAVRAW